MLPIMFYNKLNPFGIRDQRILLSFRGILSVFGLIFLYLSFTYIKIYKGIIYCNSNISLIFSFFNYLIFQYFLTFKLILEI